MIQSKVSSTLPPPAPDQKGVSKKSSWTFRLRKPRSISIPEPKPFKENADKNVPKRKGWLYKSAGEITQPPGNKSIDKTPENEVKLSVSKSSRLFSRASHHKSPLPPNTLGSSESEHHDLLSTESVDLLKGNVSSVIKYLEEDDSIPIVFATYSGEPLYRKDIEEPELLHSQLVTFNQFDHFEEATYHSWNVWRVGVDGEKIIGDSIECKMDFVDFFKKFCYEKVYIMRSILVPTHNLFKNGYLVKLKLGKDSAEVGLKMFMTCCKNSILNKVPNNAIKINVCGFTYTRKGYLTQITLWIHPVMNMSFDISNQVSLLVKLLNLETTPNKITLIDVNNGSRTEIV